MQVVGRCRGGRLLRPRIGGPQTAVRSWCDPCTSARYTERVARSCACQARHWFRVVTYSTGVCTRRRRHPRPPDGPRPHLRRCRKRPASSRRPQARPARRRPRARPRRRRSRPRRRRRRRTPAPFLIVASARSAARRAGSNGDRLTVDPGSPLPQCWTHPPGRASEPRALSGVPGRPRRRIWALRTSPRSQRYLLRTTKAARPARTSTRAGGREVSM